MLNDTFAAGCRLHHYQELVGPHHRVPGFAGMTVHHLPRKRLHGLVPDRDGGRSARRQGGSGGTR